MTAKMSSTNFRLVLSLIIVFIALGITFVACKPAQQTEEKITAPEPAPAEQAAPTPAPTPAEQAAPAPTTPTAKATFKWTPVKAGATEASIPLGKSVVCPFEFAVADPSIKKISFSIKDDKLAKMGIVIAEEKVDIAEGKAKSDAMFGIAPGSRLGEYKLEIVAKNADTGEVIGEGVIPFKILPKGAGGC